MKLFSRKELEESRSWREPLGLLRNAVEDDIEVMTVQIKVNASLLSALEKIQGHNEELAIRVTNLETLLHRGTMQ